MGSRAATGGGERRAHLEALAKGSSGGPSAHAILASFCQACRSDQGLPGQPRFSGVTKVFQGDQGSRF